jgi:putative long chain acyl-CoA synthase
LKHADERDRRTSSLISQLVAAWQNGVEIARFGGFGDPQSSPHRIVAKKSHYRLRHYFPDAARGPAILLVPPLMITAEVWDVSPETSAVAALHDAGADPWVVDFGSPEKEKGGLSRTLTDHVLAVSEAVDTVRDETGRDVHLAGYSQGGMFCYQAAAYRESKGLASLITFGSPVDLHKGLPPILPTELAADILDSLGSLQSMLFPSGIPSWATRLGFQLLDPVKTIRQRLEFALKLYDRETLQRTEGMRRFLGSEGWVAFPGPALQDFVEQLIADNRLLSGGLVIAGRPVTLANVSCPILTFIGDSDSIAPGGAVRAIRDAAPRARTYEVRMKSGHFGLVVGSRSSAITWPTVAEWVLWCDGEGRKPAAVSRIAAKSRRPDRPTSLIEDLSESVFRTVDVGRSVASSALDMLGNQVGVLGRLSMAIAPQMMRLDRLASLRSDTRISLGEAVERQAAQAPDDTFFLFEGRAYSYREANRRVDNIVRGFIDCGVRQGQHVGVLMGTRPSALAATVALSRLGAVAVMLRPDISLKRQLQAAPVDHLLADPEHGAAAAQEFGREVLVLGGGGDRRRLSPGLLDMEAIDPDAVELPQWYTPNPGTAGEVALIFIAGDDDHPSAGRVTNRRWATSAYGTASACALGTRDTVYCCAPTHHPTGLLVCVAGAIVSGARLAVAAGFDPATFWDEIRRYGVSFVAYSGIQLQDLVNAPEGVTERSNPIRIFAGSGIPYGLWKRLHQRFPDASVVEFYASTEGNAVLVNLTGEKIGSIGRPLPGGAELAVAAWNLDDGRLIEDDAGFAVPCGVDQTGLLLAGVDRSRGEVTGKPMRSVFVANDAWISTGDLVRRDADGDYWLVDRVADVAHTARGAIATIPIQRKLSDLDFVDLAAVYGVPPAGGEREILVAAITLRPGCTLDARALRRHVDEHLPAQEKPAVVRVVDELPTTAGHRVRKPLLRRAGLKADEGGRTLWLAPGAKSYVRLTEKALATLSTGRRRARSGKPKAASRRRKTAARKKRRS